MSREHAIAVFDSGIGGITVLKAIKQLLPNERILYLADNQRMPYGSRPAEQIVEYTEEAIRFFQRQNVKLVVFACHTVSSVVTQSFPIPVVNVIQGGIAAITELPKCKKVAILGTERTVRSGAYQRSLSPRIEVQSIACPKLASMIEYQDAQVSATVREYLSQMQKVDAVLLACTHYPLIFSVFAEAIDKTIHILDSAEKTAQEVKKVLEEKNLLHIGSSEYRFYVTASPMNFERKASHFLGEKMQAHLIDLSSASFLGISQQRGKFL